MRTKIPVIRPVQKLVGQPDLYVKLVNVDKPENAFYLGGGTFENQRGFQFGKDSKVACYGCQPKSGPTSNLPVNCSPNDGDPAKRAACWQGFDALDCSRQQNCTNVVDITECYSQNVGIISSTQPNDLKLCDSARSGLNLGVGSNSELAKSEATAQRGQGTGAKAGSENLSAQTGLAAPAA